MLSLALWTKWYKWIAEVMGYDIDEDRRATLNLASMLKGLKPPSSLIEGMILNRNVIVFGAGPSLDPTLDLLEEARPSLLKGSVLIAADGAAQALIERGLRPDVIVSDLDGGEVALMKAAETGAVIAIHAHGDNVEAMEDIVPDILRVTRRILGTTQVEPIPPVYNFGGFTDGDRAVFLASYFNASRVLMVGMDFGRIIGRRSKPWLSGGVEAGSVKAMKLEIAYMLISWLASLTNTRIYTLSERAPPGTLRINLEDLNENMWC